MTSKPRNEPWTAPRLAARLSALGGEAPEPLTYVIYRETAISGTPARAAYAVPAEPLPLDPAGFAQWLRLGGLTGPRQLAVSVLAIREILDTNGLIVNCTLERRRGLGDGPLSGRAARVSFSGAARQIVVHDATASGGLMERPGNIQAAPDPASAPEPLVEGFAGDDAAVHSYLGPGAMILDRRMPNADENRAGLAAIVHARRHDGFVIGCGVGWHGTMSYVLAADFPREPPDVIAPPELVRAAALAAEAQDLTLHETRLGPDGHAIVGRRRGRQELVAIRLDGQHTRIEPWLPGRNAAAAEDQRRWMIYAESYEARLVLDSWPVSTDGTIAVVTIDPDGEAWRHIVDVDGVEIGRRTCNEAASAVLHRERVARRPDGAASPPPGPSEGGAE